MKFKIGKILIEIKISFIIFTFIYLFSISFRNIFYYYFACYMFIMFHEFSHILVASLFKYELKKIEFSICGMSANLNMSNHKLKNIFVFLAGPISNMILAILFCSNNFIFTINLVLLFVNLIPIFPLDGYRIVKQLNFNIKKIEIIIYIIILLLSLLLSNISFIMFIIYITFLKNNMNQNVL